VVTTSDSVPDAAAATSTADLERPSQDGYTGVVVIHGLGDEKRKDTLLEIVNTLVYWFNNRAELALRPSGPGRVWLQTQLSESSDPESVSSRAMLELRAPAEVGGDPSGGPTLRLAFREVWWAATFGLQPLGTSIRWAQVQWSEQMRHILIPVGRLSRRASLCEEAQAKSSAPPARSGFRPLLRGALAFYTVIQHTWKIVQWLVLSPFVALPLLLMSLARVLSSIGLIRNALLATFNALSSYVMLHWITSTQVYMRDYARAASIRQLFERELDDFLCDDRCDRVIVLAHSMGTVIAYEGLTTLPGRLGTQSSPKPITLSSTLHAAAGGGGLRASRSFSRCSVQASFSFAWSSQSNRSYRMMLWPSRSARRRPHLWPVVRPHEARHGIA
jgi:hypothetical protein